MLVIREQQMQVLGEAAVYNRLEAKVGKLFPQHCRNLGVAGTREAIQAAVGRARRLGFEAPQFLGYTALEFVFGPEFFKQPNYQWAADILDERGPTPAARMQKLREASVFYLARLAES